MSSWYLSFGGRPAAAGRSARDGAERVVAVVAVALRLVVAVMGGLAAVLGIAPPARPSWVYPAVVANLLWACGFGLLVRRLGLRGWLVAVDLGVICVLCLTQVRLTADDSLSSGVGWVTAAGTVAIVVAHLTWRPLVATIGCVAVMAAYLTGVWSAGLPDRGLVQVAVYVIQFISSGAMIWLLRRSAASADAALARYEQTRAESVAATARRSQEREHNRRLHDTILATLTMVGAGAITSLSPVLRQRAKADLAVVDGEDTAEIVAAMRAGVAGDDLGTDPSQAQDIRLDRALRRLAGAPGGLTVSARLRACVVPAPVARAFVGAVHQALANVARHAAVDTAVVALTGTDPVVVEVTDTGRGFAPTEVPAHRYGLREAIKGRMWAVGGYAEVASAPGAGTRVRLVWPTRTTGADADPDPAATIEPGDSDEENRVDLVIRHYTRGIAIAAVTILGLWHVFADLTATLSGWSEYRYPLAAGVSWLAFAGLAAGYSVALLRGRPPRSGRWPAGVALLLISAAVHISNAPQHFFDRTNWAWAAIGWPALVVFWRRPVRALVPLLGANAVLTLAVMIWDGQADASGLSRYLAGVTVVYVLQFGSAAGVQALRGAAGSIARASAARERELAVRAASEQIHLVRRQRYEALRQETATLLADLAYGAADTGAVAVQRRCAGEAARLRRLMAESDDVADPLLHELRAGADIAERKGVLVVLVVVGRIPTLPVPVRRALAEAPIALLAVARGRARITVVATRQEVTVAVLADGDFEPPAAATLVPDPAAVGVLWARDDELWWVQTQISLTPDHA